MTPLGASLHTSWPPLRRPSIPIDLRFHHRANGPPGRWMAGAHPFRSVPAEQPLKPGHDAFWQPTPQSSSSGLTRGSIPIDFRFHHRANGQPETRKFASAAMRLRPHALTLRSPKPAAHRPQRDIHATPFGKPRSRPLASSLPACMGTGHPACRFHEKGVPDSACFGCYWFVSSQASVFRHTAREHLLKRSCQGALPGTERERRKETKLPPTQAS